MDVTFLGVFFHILFQYNVLWTINKHQDEVLRYEKKNGCRKMDSFNGIVFKKQNTWVFINSISFDFPILVGWSEISKSQQPNELAPFYFRFIVFFLSVYVNLSRWYLWIVEALIRMLLISFAELSPKSVKFFQKIFDSINVFTRGNNFRWPLNEALNEHGVLNESDFDSSKSHFLFESIVFIEYSSWKYHKKNEKKTVFIYLLFLFNSNWTCIYMN